ncbi:MAG: DUF4358 domain-containing protein [Clostridia bacterium]|nr:DUF4358 domain-containing protein [Clostridia bacterium]
MNRLLALLLSALLCLTVFTACGDTKTITDPAALAEALCNDSLHGTDLYPIDNSLIASVLAVTAPYTAAHVYATAGDAADEIAVFVAESEAAAAAILEQLEAHQVAFSQLYSTYAPDQCPRIDGALLEQVGNTVVWCIGHDSDAARKLMYEYCK